MINLSNQFRYITGAGGRPLSGCIARVATEITDFGASYQVAFDEHEYDYGGWHDKAINNSRLTVPLGITLVRVSASLRLNAVEVQWSYTRILKNGSEYPGMPTDSDDAQFTDVRGRQSLMSPVLEVTAGDYFELDIQSQSATRDIAAGDPYTWFSIEAWK